MRTSLFVFAVFLGITSSQQCTDLWGLTCSYYKDKCQDPTMRQHLIYVCAKTCGACGGCQDDNPSCPSWKTLCHQNNIKSLCKLTCGACGPPTQMPPTHGPPTHGPPTHGPPTHGPPGQCGVSSIAGSRVIAGVTATKGAWPWQGLMSYNGRAGCGCSLVSPQWVVTAAHCVKGKESNPSAFSIRFGEHDRNTPEGTEETIPVSRVISHPNFGTRGNQNMDYDVALFKLSRPPKMTRFVSTVCLPDGSRPVPVGTDCYITGWGKIMHPGSMHHVLQQAKMRVVDNSVCHALNFRSTRIPVTQTMVCAGSGGQTRESGCHGDSGGPFVCRTGSNGAWELHGAVSWGSGTCSSSQTYTVFSRITALRGWIDQQMSLY